MLRIADENWKLEKKPTKTIEKQRAMNVAKRYLDMAKEIGDLETVKAIETYWPDLKVE